MTSNAVEEAFVRAFVHRDRKQRWLEALSSLKHRAKLCRSLAHLNTDVFDQRFLQPISDPSNIERMLRSKGAPELCRTISEQPTLDAKDLALRDVLSEISGRGIGTILVCVPDKLAYFENEDGRWLFER